MTEYGFLSIIPPILSIVLSIITRRVIFSLFIGIFSGCLIIQNGNIFSAFFATVDTLINVFKSKSNTEVIIFTLLIGSLIHLIQISGGEGGFVKKVQNKILQNKNPNQKLQIVTSITGLFIFVESNMSILTVGTIYRPLFDKYKIAREKLAYISDSVSAPSCILFPINAWGAYIIGILSTYEYVDPLRTLVFSIPLNFYPIVTILFVFYLSITGKEYGEMKKVQKKYSTAVPSTIENTQEGKAYNMLAPLIFMIISMPFFLIYTGWDVKIEGSFLYKVWISIQNGSGSSSVLYSVICSLVFSSLLFAYQKIVSLKSFFEESIKGMEKMLLMAILMIFAFAIGKLCNEIETGIYVANIAKEWLSPSFAPALIFLISCFIAFSTGTSWGTFAIMLSIVVPLISTMSLNPYLVISAVLGGGVFGDHCSPISDTTIISSMASGVDHIQHVRTQLPYAIFTGTIAFLLYIIFGLFL